MKKILLLFFLFLINTSYSQEATIFFESPKTYSFIHESIMDENRIERYTTRMLNDCNGLESISFIENKVVFIMKNCISEETINTTIHYCITKFGFTTYKISEL